MQETTLKVGGLFRGGDRTNGLAEQDVVARTGFEPVLPA